MCLRRGEIYCLVIEALRLSNEPSRAEEIFEKLTLISRVDLDKERRLVRGYFESTKLRLQSNIMKMEVMKGREEVVRKVGNMRRGEEMMRGLPR